MGTGPLVYQPIELLSCVSSWYSLAFCFMHVRMISHSKSHCTFEHEQLFGRVIDWHLPGCTQTFIWRQMGWAPAGLKWPNFSVYLWGRVLPPCRKKMLVCLYPKCCPFGEVVRVGNKQNMNLVCWKFWDFGLLYFMTTVYIYLSHFGSRVRVRVWLQSCPEPYTQKTFLFYFYFGVVLGVS